MPRITDVRLRRGVSSDWATTNPILSAGEPGLESDTGDLKFGDGTLAWNSLPYFKPTNVTGIYTPLTPTGWNNLGVIVRKDLGDYKQYDVDIELIKTTSALALSTTFVSLGVVVPVELRTGATGPGRYLPIWVTGSGINLAANLYTNFVSGEFMLRLSTGTATIPVSGKMNICFTIIIPNGVF